jgi:hypothetical protein
MGYLLKKALQKRFIAGSKNRSEFGDYQFLLAEQIPVVQPLHIHQEVVNQGEVSHANNQRDHSVHNRLTHDASSSARANVQESPVHARP